jgi:hypothetical protein
MAPQMSKEEQRRQIRPLADKLAQSGKYSGWYAIERKLVDELDMPEARHVLDDEFTRNWLDRLCAQAQQGKRNA